MVKWNKWKQMVTWKVGKTNLKNLKHHVDPCRINYTTLKASLLYAIVNRTVLLRYVL